MRPTSPRQSPLADCGPSEIGLLDAATLTPIRSMDGSALPLAFSRDGSLLLAGTDDGATIFEVASGDRRLDLRLPIPDPGIAVPAGAFLADGAHVRVKPAPRPETWIYELGSGTLVGRVCSGEDSIRVALHRAGEVLAVADHPGSIERWRVDDLLRLPAAGAAPLQSAGDTRDMRASVLPSPSSKKVIHSSRPVSSSV